MTAEIAILNKEAVALAADSAMTAGIGDGRKIFATADKIFMLCANRPVGVMVYNNAQFIGVPWDTVIHEIGKQLPKGGFKTLDGYVKAFLGYFEKDAYLFPEAEQRRYFMLHIYYCCHMTRQVILKRVKGELERRGPLSDRSIRILVSKVVKDELSDWMRLKEHEKESSIKRNTSEEMMQHYRSSIQEVVNEVFQKIPISRRARKELLEILKYFISFGQDQRLNTGVVIAGFGEREAFPSVRSFTFEGLFNGKLKYANQANTVIGDGADASILAFAQGEMVARFMEGVDPDYRKAERSFMSQLSERFPEAVVKGLRKYNAVERRVLLRKMKDKCTKIFDEYAKGMDEEIQRHFISPVTVVVAILGKSDLATLAEALVSITSIKRKFSSGSETVAEPIDVAVVSKSEGFVWIKRKRYC